MSALLLLGFYLQAENQRYHNYNFFVFLQGIRASTITFLLITNFSSLDVEIVFLGHLLLLIQSVMIFPFLVGNLKITKWSGIMLSIIVINDYTDFFGFFNLFNPTLAQYPIFLPKFHLFLSVIYGLDILLLILGVILIINFSQKSKSE